MNVCARAKHFFVTNNPKLQFPILRIFTNWCYETTLVRFVFTWPLCWSKKHHYSGVHRGPKFMLFDKSRVKSSQNHTSNLDKVFLKLPPSSDFGLEAKILQIGWFYRPKWKKVKKSASKNKHPIKLCFLIWRLQSANPEKKSNSGKPRIWIMSFSSFCK